MEYTDKYPHDPEFPYLVISASHGLVAKFKNPSEAEALKEIGGVSYGVATTLLPAIPRDFRYITWNRSRIPHYAHRIEDKWVYGQDLMTEETLLRDHIGDAPITGLKPTTSGMGDKGYGQGLIQGR